MGILLYILFGAIAGWAASVIMKTNAQQGTLTDIVVGIIGAIVGGFVMGLFGAEGVTGFNLYSFFVAIVGASLLITIVRAVTKANPV